MKLYYVEVHETRRMVASFRAESEEQAREIAIDRAKANELEVDIFDREAVVVEHPASKEAA